MDKRVDLKETSSENIVVQPRTLIDGQEGTAGRALLTFSALHHCVPVLRGYAVEVIYCDSPCVLMAAAVLASDHGVCISCFPSKKSAARWAGAVAYVSTRFRVPDDVACNLAEQHQVAPLIAIQFPPPYLFGQPLMRRVRAAHDPAVLGRMIETFLSGGASRAA